MLVQKLICSLIISVVSSINNSEMPGEVKFEDSPLTKSLTQEPKVDTTVYVVVQVQPEFPGGRAGMFRFIQSTSKYPVSSVPSKVAQSVFIRLLIEKDGSISKVTLPFAKLTGELEREAERIGKEMPKWKPGSHYGQPIRVNVITPIHFQLNK